MAIHLNPFRLFSGRLVLNQGLLVEILRNTKIFWEAYKRLLELNGRKSSDIKDLKVLMGKMGIVPKEKKKASETEIKKAVVAIDADFDRSLEQLDDMFRSIKTIILDDETFMFRAVEDIRKMYLTTRKITHVPEYMQENIQKGFYELLHHISEVQHHAWIVSKAHSRNAIKLEELTIISSWAERKRIRMQTLELDHLRNMIEPLREKVENMSRIKEHEHIHDLYDGINRLLQLYHEQIADLSAILKESDVLIKRTENLLTAIEHEAESLGVVSLKKKVNSYASKFHKLLVSIESQARRENMDIDHIVKRLPAPIKAKAKAA